MFNDLTGRWSRALLRGNDSDRSGDGGEGGGGDRVPPSKGERALSEPVVELSDGSDRVSERSELGGTAPSAAPATGKGGDAGGAAAAATECATGCPSGSLAPPPGSPPEASSDPPSSTVGDDDSAPSAAPASPAPASALGEATDECDLKIRLLTQQKDILRSENDDLMRLVARLRRNNKKLRYRVAELRGALGLPPRDPGDDDDDEDNDGKEGPNPRKAAGTAFQCSPAGPERPTSGAADGAEDDATSSSTASPHATLKADDETVREAESYLRVRARRGSMLVSFGDSGIADAGSDVDDVAVLQEEGLRIRSKRGSMLVSFGDSETAETSDGREEPMSTGPQEPELRSSMQMTLVDGQRCPRPEPREEGPAESVPCKPQEPEQLSSAQVTLVDGQWCPQPEPQDEPKTVPDSRMEMQDSLRELSSPRMEASVPFSAPVNFEDGAPQSGTPDSSQHDSKPDSLEKGTDPAPGSSRRVTPAHESPDEAPFPSLEGTPADGTMSAVNESNVGGGHRRSVSDDSARPSSKISIGAFLQSFRRHDVTSAHPVLSDGGGVHRRTKSDDSARPSSESSFSVLLQGLHGNSASNMQPGPNTTESMTPERETELRKNRSWGWRDGLANQRTDRPKGHHPQGKRQIWFRPQSDAAVGAEKGGGVAA